MSTKNVRIVDIHSDSSSYRDLNKWVGKIGTFIPYLSEDETEGYKSGRFLSFDDKSVTFFYKVKVEDVPEGELHPETDPYERLFGIKSKAERPIKEKLSKCCGGKIKIDMSPDFPGDDPKTMKIGTCSYRCQECGEPCDVMKEEVPIIEGLLFTGERHGHPDFYKLCEEEMNLYGLKNNDYTFGGDPMGNFKRVACILALYPGLKLSNPATVGIVYLCKQFDAALNMLSKQYEGKVEGQKERLQDVSVYSKIISILIEEQKKRVD